MSYKLMFLVFSIIHLRESNQILKGNDDNLCLQKGGVEKKKLKTPILAYQLRTRIRY